MSSGPPPGIDLYADNRGAVIGPVIALMALAAVSVALRIMSRLCAMLTQQWDDYFIFAALVCISIDLAVFGY
jgi:hypothetical protein